MRDLEANLGHNNNNVRPAEGELWKVDIRLGNQVVEADLDALIGPSVRGRTVDVLLETNHLYSLPDREVRKGSCAGAIYFKEKQG